VTIPSAKSTYITSRKRIEGYESLIVGESIQRYHIGSKLWIDTSKDGIKYKNRPLYVGPKLLIRKTGVGISAAIDYSGSFVNQVVYVFRPRENRPRVMPLEFFLGVLNSRAMYYYLVKNHGETEWRSHPYITQKQILDFPLPEMDPLLSEKVSIVGRIVRILKPFTMRNREITPQADAAVENLVAKLYGLKRRDYEVIYDTLGNVEELVPVRALKRVTIDTVFHK